MSLGLVSQELEGLKFLGVSAPKSKFGALKKIGLVLWRLQPHKSPSWCLETDCNHLYIVSILLQRLY